ncbi:MAG: caspase family protein [Chitinophagales bacterium]
MPNQTISIYALFVAINNYAYIRGLNGCINDANNLQGYLTEAAEAQNRKLCVEELHNENATKENIVQRFNEHLGQATENDICLFYFSGHGAQEDAHPAFRLHEEDNKLEVLVCHESRVSQPSSFLADKELRYMIHQLYQKTKAQIITIFDCCNSGTNTRDKLTARSFRRAADIGSREWEDFLFAETTSEESVRNAAALGEVLPQGNHIQLAACENKQSAYEVRGNGETKGIFTSGLVALLRQTKGDISYQELISVLRLKIQGSYKQTPQLYTKGNELGNGLAFQSFLGGITQHQKEYDSIVYNVHEYSWILGKGAINGISASNPHLKIELLNVEEKAIEQAQIHDVQLDYTKLSFSETMQLDELFTYKVKVTGLIANPLNVYCMGEETVIAALKEYVHAADNDFSFLQWVDEPHFADYFVNVCNHSFAIRLPFNDLPITANIEGYDETAIEQLLSYLKYIARWTAIKNLENPHSNIQPNPPFEVEIFSKQADGSEESLEVKDGKVQIDYTGRENGTNDRMAEIRIRLQNNTNRDYYCALVYLAQDFSIEPEFLEGGVVELPAGQSVFAVGGQHIPDTQSAFIQHYNWKAETHYLQLIISTHTFEVQILRQDELPMPSTRRTRGGEDTRGVPPTRKLKRPDSTSDWTTQLIELKMPNPDYQEENDTPI